MFKKNRNQINTVIDFTHARHEGSASPVGGNFYRLRRNVRDAIVGTWGKALKTDTWEQEKVAGSESVSVEEHPNINKIQRVWETVSRRKLFMCQCLLPIRNTSSQELWCPIICAVMHATAVAHPCHAPLKRCVGLLVAMINLPQANFLNFMDLFLVVIAIIFDWIIPISAAIAGKAKTEFFIKVASRRLCSPERWI